MTVPLNLTTARKRFGEQQRNAAHRGIDFLFTFEEWIGWWEAEVGTAWMGLRGRGIGKYCMARIGDSGPYMQGNVKCILHSSNASESSETGSIAKGERAGQARLTEKAVLEIFFATETVIDVAAAHGVSVGTVIDIRSKRTWRHVVGGLTRQSLRGINGGRRRR